MRPSSPESQAHSGKKKKKKKLKEPPEFGGFVRVPFTVMFKTREQGRKI